MTNLPEILHNWLPGSLPRKRRDVPVHMTHAWATRLMEDNQIFHREYEGADRRVILGLFDAAMGSDDYWNVLAEAYRIVLESRP